MDKFDSIKQIYKLGYKDGIVDALSVALGNYDKDKQAFIVPQNISNTIMRELGVNIVTAMKEDRYKLAAAVSGRSVDQLKAIDTEGPCCEAGLPVYECILQKCGYLEHCHFKIKE